MRQLSADCAAQMNNILWDYDILVHLDVIFARAQLSYQLNAATADWLQQRRDGAADREAGRRNYKAMKANEFWERIAQEENHG